MTTSDGARLDLPLGDPLEADLVDLFAVQPTPSVLDRLDRRVQGAMRAWTPRAARGSRLRPGRRAATTGLLAAAFAVAGANGSLNALYGFLAGPFDLPWHRGTELNLSQVVDGYRVTLDRAYADSTRLALAISVVDELERAGTTQVQAFSTIVTDEAGEYGGLGAASSPDGSHAAANVAWKTPAALPLPAGPRQFHVVLPFIMVRDDTTPPPDADAIGWDPWRRHPGPWTFDFEINVDGGTAVTPTVVDEIDGAGVSVVRLIAAPNIVRVELDVDERLLASGWNPIGEIRHDGRVLKIVFSSIEPDGRIAIMTDSGVGDASGEWTVEISDDGSNAELAGPWVLRFNAP